MSAEEALAYLSGPAPREAGVKASVIASSLPVVRDAVAREQAAAKKAAAGEAAAEETPAEETPATESIAASEAADPSPPPPPPPVLPPPPPPPPATPTPEDLVAKAKAIRAAFDARVAAERAARDD